MIEISEANQSALQFVKIGCQVDVKCPCDGGVKRKVFRQLENCQEQAININGVFITCCFNAFDLREIFPIDIEAIAKK